MYIVPEEMLPWGIYVDEPAPSKFGQYEVIEINPADIETHHQATVLDENGLPLRGVWVCFCWPGNRDLIRLRPRVNHWVGAPAVLNGVAVKTNAAGYAQATFGQSFHSILVWDIDGGGELRLPSPIVQHCISVQTSMFVHTGVHATFQRKATGVVSVWEEVRLLKQRVEALEGKGLEGHIPLGML